MGGQVYLTLRFYFLCDRAAAAVARAEPQWRAWMNAQFPMPVAMPAEASAATA